MSRAPGRRARGCVRRRPDAAIREPRLCRQHTCHGLCLGRRRGLRTLVQQRAPRQRRQVAGGDRRVRGLARRGRRLRGGPSRTTPSSSCATPPRRSTCSPPRCRTARACSPAPPSTTPTCSPGRRHDVRLLPFTRSPDELLEATERALRAERIDLRRRHRRLQRHRRGVAGRSSSPGFRARARRGSCSSTPPSSPRTARSTWLARRDRPPGALRPQALRPVSASGALVGRLKMRLNRRPPLARRRRDQARHRRRRHLGARPGPLRGRLAQRGRRDRAGRRLPQPDGRSAWTRSPAHERSLAVRMWDGAGSPSPASRDADASGRPAASTASASPPSTSPATRDPLLAAILSAEHAIGVRHGCFCAHPLMTHLLGVLGRRGGSDSTPSCASGRRPQLPGAVRASIGIGTPPWRTSTGSSAPCARDRPRRSRARATVHVPEHDEYEPLERLAA